jgi:methylated-DNA-[protein]-cysteine S-methyltransferase
MNDVLTASNANLNTIVDRTLDKLRGITQRGNNIVTTLNARAQRVAVQNLAGKCGGVVAVDDVSFDVADTQIGPLLLAVTERGLCRISFDPEPDRETETLARTFGVRVLRAPRELDPVRRELDEYFEGRRRAFDLPLDLRGREGFSRDILERLAKVPYGEVTTYKSLAVEAGNPRAARAVGTIMNRNPIPIVLPCHRVVGSNGSLVGYGGGLERKRLLLDLEAGTPRLDIHIP